MKLREEEFYYQYHQHGGTTIIPTEIFNELYDDATEEIERLKSIIREAREYIQKKLTEDDNGCGCWWYSFEYYVNAKKELLKILDEEAQNDKRRNSKNSS